MLLVGLLVVVVGFNLGGGRGWGFWGLGFRFGFEWFMGRFGLYGLVDCGWVGFSIEFCCGVGLLVVVSSNLGGFRVGWYGFGFWFNWLLGRFGLVALVDRCWGRF